MAKKSFSEVNTNPVDQFFTTEPTKPLELTDRPATPADFDTESEEAQRQPQAERAKASEEPRTRRVQLILKKSLYVAMRNAAKRQRKSFNHLCEIVFTDYIERYNTEGGGKRR